MTNDPQHDRERARKFRRARIRNFVFTAGPQRMTRGRLARRHLSRELVVREVTLASPLWPKEHDGLRIGHVSDFHLGSLITVERGLEAVRLLAEREPDLVACTGDVVDLRHDDAPPLLDALAAIDAPLGSYLVLGNHDELHCPATLARYANHAGVLVLEDEAAQCTWRGNELVIGGIGWAATTADCATRIDRMYGDPVHVLLAHNPRAFLRAAELDIPITLSGHTHGGQVALSRKRPRANLALGHRHRSGEYELDGSMLYVTNGVGAWFPLRVNCPAEVVVVTMRTG